MYRENPGIKKIDFSQLGDILEEWGKVGISQDHILAFIRYQDPDKPRLASRFYRWLVEETGILDEKLAYYRKIWASIDMQKEAWRSASRSGMKIPEMHLDEMDGIQIPELSIADLADGYLGVAIFYRPDVSQEEKDGLGEGNAVARKALEMTWCWAKDQNKKRSQYSEFVCDLEEDYDKDGQEAGFSGIQLHIRHSFPDIPGFYCLKVRLNSGRRLLDHSHHYDLTFQDLIGRDSGWAYEGLQFTLVCNPGVFTEFSNSYSGKIGTYPCIALSDLRSARGGMPFIATPVNTEERQVSFVIYSTPKGRSTASHLAIPSLR